MTTLTPDQEQAIHDKLASIKHIPVGLGTEHEACSIAAINLALSGRLTDDIPPCMSEIIGRWIIHIQDAMPDSMRNSPEWRALLPLAAGTGREHEAERLDVIMDWMWATVLPTLQLIADKEGFGPQWAAMCKERTAKAAWAAEAAAWAAEAAAETAAWAAGAAAWAAPRAAWAQFNPIGLLQKLIEVAP